MRKKSSTTKRNKNSAANSNNSEIEKSVNVAETPKSCRKTIVYASDGNDIELLKASIFSVRTFFQDDVDIYVLSDTLSYDEVPTATVIDPTSCLSEVGFYCDGWNRKWPYATLFRLMIPLLNEFKDLDRVLYLDTDVLVKSSIAMSIFDKPNEGHEILAAEDSNGTWERIDKCVRRDLSLEATVKILQGMWGTRNLIGFTYVNAGVSMWYVKNILKNGIDWYKDRLKWFWEAETSCKFDYLDQDFINSMMDTSPALPREYNYFADLGGDESRVLFKHFLARTKQDMITEAKRIGYVSSEDSRERIIVYASDGNDADRLRVSAMSAKKYIGGNLKFYILTELRSYPALKEATLINPKAALKEVGFFDEGWNRKWPFSCLFRLAIPLLEEFKDIDKVLYLDTDTLVRSAKAKKLFDMKSCGFEAYGAQDIEARQLNIEGIMANDLSLTAKKQMRKKLWDPKGKATMGYVNSGVILEMLDEIRKNGIDWYVQRLKWFWEAILKAKFHFPDQDFINVMMDISPSLSVKYNRFCGDAGTNCVIQHFVGNNKGLMMRVASQIGL